MISIDTNIFLYAQNKDCPQHPAAYDFVAECGSRRDVVVCELVLVELYVLLRNSVVIERPLSPPQAVAVCQTYRDNPNWRLVENAPVMAEVWSRANQPAFPRRRIFDLRLGLTLLHHGVTELVTANPQDFNGLGFNRVRNPLVADPG